MHKPSNELLRCFIDRPVRVFKSPFINIDHHVTLLDVTVFFSNFLSLFLAQIHIYVENDEINPGTYDNKVDMTHENKFYISMI